MTKNDTIKEITKKILATLGESDKIEIVIYGGLV
jgi:hypothetical protein